MEKPDEKPIADIDVRQVSNGWTVTHAGSWYSRRNGECAPEQTWVFTDVASMAAWMIENLKEPESK